MPKNTGNPFDGLVPSATPEQDRSAAEDAAALHGSSFGAVQSIRVVRIPIDSIEPDVLQPRRVIPNEVRNDWQPTASEMAAFLQQWVDDTGIAPDHYFEDDEDAPEYQNPSHRALQRLIRLAAEIHRDGLANPITVIRSEQGVYQLETGERRWLAFHLLRLLLGDDYNDIPARVMNEHSVWRQAGENNQRDDLNAIGKARQYAILLMDLLSSIERSFLAPIAFKNEQDYYAQIADDRIPYGFTEQIQTAMGFENRSSIKRHRDLLLLPNQIWQLADDYDCPESVLRRLTDEPVDVQMRLFSQWVVQHGGQPIVANGNNSKKPPSKRRSAWERNFEKLESHLTETRLRKMTRDEIQQLRDRAEALIQRIDELDKLT